MNRTWTMLAALTLGVWLGNAARAESALGWSLRYILTTATEEQEIFPVLETLGETPALLDAPMCGVVAARYAELRYQRLNAIDLFKKFRRTLLRCNDASRYQALLAVKMQGKAPAHIATLAGDTDLAAQRQGYIAAALAATPSQSQVEAIAKLPPDPAFDELFAAIGPPAHARGRDLAWNEISKLMQRRIHLYWRGIGQFTYGYEDSSRSWRYRSFTFDSLAFEGLMPYYVASEPGMAGESKLATIQLLSGQPRAMRQALEFAHGQFAMPVEFLDTAAELLLQNHRRAVTENNFSAYTWICRVLVERGGPRYQKLLARVAEETYDIELRKRALRPAAPTTRKELETPYLPGSISLPAQAAKYPSPYPKLLPVEGLPR